MVNDLFLEDYLTKVVPSEMPPSYEKEALKAQAVCARTYAYRQIQGNTYSQYGAHVDDSTNFQVYNNTSANDKSTQTVKETYGKMLFYEDKPLRPFISPPPADARQMQAYGALTAENTPI